MGNSRSISYIRPKLHSMKLRQRRVQAHQNRSSSTTRSSSRRRRGPRTAICPLKIITTTTMTTRSSTASEVAEAVQITHATSRLFRYKTEMLAAFRYLDAVKLRFDPPMPGRRIFNRRTAYHEFVYTMAEFKEQRIDVTEVVNRAKELFAGHNDLILGLTRFLPNGGSQYFGSSPPPELHLQVALKAIERQSQATTIKATALVHKIQALFSVQTDKAQQEVYKNYAAIFNDYIKGITSIPEMYTQLSQLLLAEYPDLLAELAEFFPESVRSA
ncbi:hypothetical protein BDL97_07G020200 [Sphagnum fallax]|nr:hypothetical protein BDL97_07G020200 [Sphagnum fallax]